MYACTHVCTYVGTCVGTYVCVMYAYINQCLYAYARMYVMCTYVWPLSTYTNVHACLHAPTHARTHARTHVYMYAQVCMYTYMLCYVMLCYVMLCYVMLCYVMLCYVMLRYTMLYAYTILLVYVWPLST